MEQVNVMATPRKYDWDAWLAHDKQARHLNRADHFPDVEPIVFRQQVLKEASKRRLNVFTRTRGDNVMIVVMGERAPASVLAFPKIVTERLKKNNPKAD